MSPADFTSALDRALGDLECECRELGRYDCQYHNERARGWLRCEKCSVLAPRELTAWGQCLVCAHSCLTCGTPSCELAADLDPHCDAHAAKETT